MYVTLWLRQSARKCLIFLVEVTRFALFLQPPKEPRTPVHARLFTSADEASLKHGRSHARPPWGVLWAANKFVAGRMGSKYWRRTAPVLLSERLPCR